MRTTLTLDPDVVKLLEEEAHRQRRPYKQIVNDAIRRGLAPRATRRSSKRYRVVPHEATLLPGLDRAAFNRLTDELEDSIVLAKRIRPSP
jgi:predicted transcriptional regulator